MVVMITLCEAVVPTAVTVFAVVNPIEKRAIIDSTAEKIVWLHLIIYADRAELFSCTLDNGRFHWIYNTKDISYFHIIIVII